MHSTGRHELQPVEREQEEEEEEGCVQSLSPPPARRKHPFPSKRRVEDDMVCFFPSSLGGMGADWVGCDVYEGLVEAVGQEGYVAGGWVVVMLGGVLSFGMRCFGFVFVGLSCGVFVLFYGMGFMMGVYAV